MKKTILILLSLIVTLAAQEPSGKSVLDKIIDLMNPVNARGIMKQTIETTSGQLRTFEYETFAGNKGENQLMRYRAPGRVKGNAMLMTDFSDNIWMYNKRTNRVRKLASHAKKQKFEGSDFTYEDMGSGDSWRADYKPKIAGTEKLDGEKCWLLEMTPKTDDLSYSKMVIWSRTSDLFPVRIDYYDEGGTFTKSLLMEDIRNIEGFLTPFTMTMKNHLENTQTVMEYVEVTYDITFDKNFFSERNLKK
ncbi:MAG: outer membrane lipoprotein-sorting protein [Candidatus Marinimicrobia bacterium]|nr:outer membrane lipoprotein-sorting protein [Candidatus Neomarinimicrobiota bacterium]